MDNKEQRYNAIIKKALMDMAEIDGASCVCHTRRPCADCTSHNAMQEIVKGGFGIKSIKV